MYIDGDVITCRRLAPLFDLLEQFDLVCSHAHLPHARLPKFAASASFREAKVPAAFTRVTVRVTVRVRVRVRFN